MRKSFLTRMILIASLMLMLVAFTASPALANKRGIPNGNPGNPNGNSAHFAECLGGDAGYAPTGDPDAKCGNDDDPDEDGEDVD